jgi:hypothetical protein
VVDQNVYTATGSQSGTTVTISAVSNGILCNGTTITFAGGATATVTVTAPGGCTTATGTYTATPSQTVASSGIVAGSNPWVTITDLDVENNIWTNGNFGGWNMLLQDSTASNPTAGEGGDSLPAQRWLFRNNLVLLNNDDSSSGTAFLGLASALPGRTDGSGGGGNDIIFDHNTWVPANGTNPEMFFGQVQTGTPVMALSRMVFSNNIMGRMDFKFGSNSQSSAGYTLAIADQVTQPAFVDNVVVLATADSTLPATNANPSANSSIGFTSFGSATNPAGYVLTSGSAYHAAGVSGAGLPYSSTGTADSTDLGANISLLPSN